LCVVKFGHLKRQQITGYRRLSDDVHQTRFADGTEVTADFASQELVVNGKHVTRPTALEK
jgi:hypothetical protein